MFSSIWHWCSSSPFYGYTLSKKRVQHAASFVDLWEGEDTIGQHMLTNGMQVGGRFVSLEEMIHALSDPHKSNLPGIQSFEWLRHLKKLGHNMSRKMARHLISQWIVGNQSYRTCPWRSWDPGSLGYRVSNWYTMYDFFGNSADDDFRQMFWRSLSQQVHHLQRLSLYSLSPQNRWMALKGLIMTTQMTKRYLPRLEAVLGDILWPDGGHKNLEWQLLVLRDIIDIQHHLQLKDSLLSLAIEKMAGVVRFLRNNDGMLCPLVPNAPFEILSSRFVDMVLSMADVNKRPPPRLTHTGVEKIQHLLGLFFVLTRKSSQPLIPGGVGVLDWVWTPQTDPMMMSDVRLESKQGELIALPEGDLCDVRQARKAGQKMIWQGRYQMGDAFLQRDMMLEPGLLEGREQCVGALPSVDSSQCKMIVRFHLPARAEHLETLGHFRYQDRVWQLSSQLGTLNKTKQGGLCIYNTASEGVRWAFKG